MHWVGRGAQHSGRAVSARVAPAGGTLALRPARACVRNGRELAQRRPAIGRGECTRDVQKFGEGSNDQRAHACAARCPPRRACSGAVARPARLPFSTPSTCHPSCRIARGASRPAQRRPPWGRCWLPTCLPHPRRARAAHLWTASASPRLFRSLGRLLPCSQPVFVYRPDRGAGGVTLSYDGYDFITARPCPCGGLRRRILRHIPARTDSAAAALVLTSCFIVDTFCLIAIHEGASK